MSKAHEKQFTDEKQTTNMEQMLKLISYQEVQIKATVRYSIGTLVHC